MTGIYSHKIINALQSEQGTDWKIDLMLTIKASQSSLSKLFCWMRPIMKN